MCIPAAAAVAAITVASATAGVVAQAKNAKAQTQAIISQQEVVAEENREQASAELFDQMRATRREQARIRVASGEAGLSLTSGSIEGLLMDSAMQGELQGSRTIANMESRHSANTAEAASMLSRIQKPTALGAGLQVATAAAQGWAGIQSAKLKRQGLNKPETTKAQPRLTRTP